MTSPPIALFDLDGSLADYDSAMKSRLLEMASPGEPVEGEFLDARMRQVRRDPTFWTSLQVFPGGYALLKALEADGWDIHILTKGPQSTSAAWGAKLEWVRRVLGDYPVTICADKSMVYGKVLYDDWPGYVEPWLQVRPRGAVVMPLRPYNTHYGHARCIKVDDATMDIGHMMELLDTTRSRY